jgi:hypothetical protein
MSLLPTKLQPGEDYASVEDVLNCSDLPEATIRVAGWKKNGNPLVLRVRGPSLEQRELISRESTRKDGTTDPVAEIVATIRECCLLPKFSIAQAQQLREKNGNVAEQIARFCWNLGALDQDYIDGIVQQLAGADPAPAADAAAAPAGDGA